MVTGVKKHAADITLFLIWVKTPESKYQVLQVDGKESHMHS